jgi:heme oxygenase
VLEGSTLGGLFLYSRFNRAFGLEEGKGASFLFGYGSDTARMWKSFVRTLNAVALSPLDEVRCTAAARSTFTSIGEHYARSRAPRPSTALTLASSH